MKRLDLITRDEARARLQALQELVPECVMEHRDPQGRLGLGLDLEALKQAFSDYLVDGGEERLRLDWPGKRAARFNADAPIAKTLRPMPEESVAFNSTRNLVIEGDSLDAIKLIEESYLGKVDIIYIDPPYNTGNDFVYADTFGSSRMDYLVESNQVSAAGDRLVSNPESNGRFHSDWLSMMYARLKAARSLLSDTGVGFVSIDEGEVAHLKLILSELYGSRNFVSSIVWVSNLKGRQIGSGGPARTHEYILCFARNVEAIMDFRGSHENFRALMPDVYRGKGYELKYDAKGAYVTKNELYNTNSKFNEATARTMVFNIHYNPSTEEVRVTDVEDPTVFPGFALARPHRNARAGVSWHAWRWSRAKVLRDFEDLEFQVSGSQLRIWTKVRDVDGVTMKDIIMGPSTITGQADLDALGLGRVFDTPKPVSLLQTLIGAAAPSDALVMDFFAGSGTTAEAVLRANAHDGGSRRFILVQLDERCRPDSEASRAGFSSIAEVTRERVRRAGGAVGLGASDTGFRAFRIDTTNFVDTVRTPDNLGQASLVELTGTIKPHRSAEDLLFQVMLDWGLDLSLPIVDELIEGVEVYSVDLDALIVCFADVVTEKVVQAIAKRHPLRVVFKDSAFADDASRINADQIFRELSPQTDVGTI